MTHIAYDRLEHGLVRIIIDRPAKLNALTLQMIADLHDAINTARTDPSSTALLLTGNGRAFCTGRDLSDAQAGEDARTILDAQINPMIAALYDCEVPTIVAARGPIMGIGLGLALACDIVIAGQSAAISSPFAKLGAALDSGGHYFLARAIGPRRALDLVYSAQPVTGQVLVEAGLASVCVADDAVDAIAYERAMRLARGPTGSFRLQKALLRKALSIGLNATLAEEAAIQGQLSRTADYAEGLAAFAARRDPDFVAHRSNDSKGQS